MTFMPPPKPIPGPLEDDEGNPRLRRYVVVVDDPHMARRHEWGVAAPDDRVAERIATERAVAVEWMEHPYGGALNAPRPLLHGSMLEDADALEVMVRNVSLYAVAWPVTPPAYLPTRMEMDTLLWDPTVLELEWLASIGMPS